MSLVRVVTYNLHKGVREQLRQFIRRELSSEHAELVAGDFNDWGPMARKVLHRPDFSSPELVRTFPSHWPVAALDQVMGRHLQPVASASVRGRLWRCMSDHLPLMVDWAWPKAPPRVRHG